MMSEKRALVLGATGGVGGEVASALLRHGWQVLALARDPDRARRSGPAGLVWIKGDAMNESDVVAAAEGASILFHGANPPGYRDWRGLAMPMLRHAIVAAKAADARLIYPGSVYVYGADAGDVVAETRRSIRAPARGGSASRWRRCWRRPRRMACGFSSSGPATSSVHGRRVPGSARCCCGAARACARSSRPSGRRPVTPGPTCPTSPRPWRCWPIGKARSSLRSASISKATTSTGAAWRRRSAASQARPCRSGRSRGCPSISERPSSPSCAR